MHRSMTIQGKDWIRNDYGTAFFLIEEKEHGSSVMLHEQQTPEKVKDVEEFLNDEISSRKNKVQKNPWNVKNNMHEPT